MPQIRAYPAKKRDRGLQQNPNSGKRHVKAFDPRRSTNYAHSNLIRMGYRNYREVTVKVDPSIIRPRKPVPFNAR